MSMSETIRNRIIQSNGKYFANDNISEYIHDGELELLQMELAGKYKELMETMLIDVEHDHNSNGTPERVAKMIINEIYFGRYKKEPKVTEFPNVSSLDQLYMSTGTVKSACSHHHVPIIGKFWVGILPGENVVGLSKINRLAEWIMRRPQIQEESTVQLADKLEELLKPKALGVVVRAKHLCVSMRGVQDSNTIMTTSVQRGLMKTDNDLAREFYSFVQMNNNTDEI